MPDEVQTQEAPAATDSTPVQEAPVFDPATLPPEFTPHYENAKKHFEAEKAKALSEVESRYKDYESEAKAFREMRADPVFQAWQKNGFKAPPVGTPPPPRKLPFEDMSDDEYAAVINDKKQLGAVLDRLIQERADEKIKPQVDRVELEQARFKMENEVQKFSAAHPDFWDEKVNKRFNEVAARYSGNISIDDAYKLAKYEDQTKEAIEKAHQITEGKRQASLERPGVSSARSTGAPVKVPDTKDGQLQAMRIAAEYQRAGRPIPDFEYVPA